MPDLADIEPVDLVEVADPGTPDVAETCTANQPEPEEGEPA
jgi:hypothetical protein